MSTVTYMINGQNVTVRASPEVTSGDLFAGFKADSASIQNVLQNPTGSPPPALSSTDVATLQLALSDLYTNALNGSGGSYYTVDMAQQLNFLFMSLEMVGIDPSNVNGTAASSTKWNAWRDLVVGSPVLQSYFQFANATASNSTLQAMIELDYVKTGNDLLAGQLGNLQSALTTTQKVLDNLTDLQSVHNSFATANRLPSGVVTVFGPHTLYNAVQSGFETSYRNAYSTSFTTPVVPYISIPSSSTPPAYFPYLWQYGTGGNFLNADNGISYITFIRTAALPPSQSFLSQYGLSVATGADLAYANTIFGGFSGVAYAGNANTAPLLNQASQQISFLKNAGYSLTTLGEAGFAVLPPANPATLTEDRSVDQSTKDIFGFTPGGLSTMWAELVRVKRSFSTIISTLAKQTPSGSLTDPNTLLARVRTVYNDLNNLGPSYIFISTLPNAYALGMLQKWILDSAGASTGVYQQHMTFAITAGQNLNDQQKQNVQNFLFIFEEYYKSASAVLQQITQIIQRMGQNISR